jgi:threonine dehydratase
VELLTLDQINAAAERLRPVMRLTPVIASQVLSDRTGEQVAPPRWATVTGTRCSMRTTP